jgi:hypothetical protein
MLAISTLLVPCSANLHFSPWYGGESSEMLGLFHAIWHHNWGVHTLIEMCLLEQRYPVLDCTGDEGRIASPCFIIIYHTVRLYTWICTYLYHQHHQQVHMWSEAFRGAACNKILRGNQLCQYRISIKCCRGCLSSPHHHGSMCCICYCHLEVWHILL